jgi:hypothetical protein
MSEQKQDPNKPTFETAKLCPKCGLPGEDTGATPVISQQSGRPVKVHSIFCRNETCEWYNTNWIVQVNEDGSVPAPYSQLGEKQYPKASEDLEQRVRDALTVQQQMETQPGGAEIRNPRS